MWASNGVSDVRVGERINTDIKNNPQMKKKRGGKIKEGEMK
jgi:hypothetical protein